MRPVTSADLQAWEHVVRRSAVRLARKLPASVQLDDLLQAGRAAVFDALSRTGPGDRGEHHTAYVDIRVRGAMLDELRAQDWLSRRSRRRMKAEGLTFRRVDIDTARDGALAAADRRFEIFDAASVVGPALASLPPREQEILRLHFFEDMPQREIASRLGVSDPRISQLVARAVGRMRDRLEPWSASSSMPSPSSAPAVAEPTCEPGATPTRKRPGRPPDQRVTAHLATMHEMRRNRCTYKQIASAVGIPWRTVRRHLLQAGVYCAQP
jgi:RNA polymerase sigma factor (sigma-70 family)